MQRLGGLLLMLAGASLGAYSMIPPPHDGEEKLREVTRISAAPDRTARPAAPVSNIAAAPPVSVSAASAAASDDAAPQKASELAAAMPSRPSSSWSAIVSSDASSQQGRLTSSKPGDGEARSKLTRDLQQELQRVGCYGGEITGNWTPSTKRAMSTFMDRVNATLPMDEPDYILLTLVQGHAATACGTECPSGQAISANGKCIPNAVVAGATRKTQREEQRRVSDEQRTAAQDGASDAQRIASEARAADAKRVEETKRVAIEKRLADEKRVAEQRVTELKAKARAELAAAAIVRKERSAQVSEQTIAQAGPELLPWLKDDQLQVQEATTTPNRPDGMMSVGGPKMAKAEIPESAMSVTPDTGPLPMEPDASNASEDAALPDDDASPVITVPAPVEVKRPAVNNSQQGFSGSKSGPAAVRGRPGSKSGITERGLPGSKSGAAAWRHTAPQRAYRPRAVVKRRAQPPAYVYRAPKPKFYYFAAAKPKKSKMYRPHYNMMQAYSGMY